MKVHMQLAPALVAVASCLAPAPSAAQLAHPVPVAGTRLELSLAHPFLEDQEFGISTGSVLARLTLPTADDGVSLFVEWGVAHASRALDVYLVSPSSFYAPAKTSGTAAANLALGAVFGTGDANSGSVSVSLPISWASEDGDVARAVAVFADADHMERFLDEVWAVEGAFRSNHRLASGAQVGFRVGAAVLGSSRQGRDTEVYARYAAFGSVPTGPTELGAELSGVAWLSQDNLSLGRRTYHQLTLLAGLPHAGPAPQLFVRLPLDSDVGDVLKLAVGLRVTF